MFHLVHSLEEEQEQEQKALVPWRHGWYKDVQATKLPNTKNKTGTSETNETSIIAIVLTLGIQSK